MPKGIVNVYLWQGQGYHLPICRSHACIACKSSSYMELPPAPVPLSLSLWYLPKVHCILSKGCRPTGLEWRSVSNHLSRLDPQRSHWPGNKSHTGGSGVGVSLFGSLSSERAKTCVMGVNKGCGSPDLRAWVMVWNGLWGWRESLSESAVKSKCQGTKSSSKWHRNLVAGERGSLASSCSGPGGTIPTATSFCTTSVQPSLTSNGVPWVSSTLATYRWLRLSPIILGMVLAKAQRDLWKEMGTECTLHVSASSCNFEGKMQCTDLCANASGLSEKGKVSVIVWF